MVPVTENQPGDSLVRNHFRGAPAGRGEAINTYKGPVPPAAKLVKMTRVLGM